ncbi:hypothetical protein HMPREF0731_2913 [Pseudoroseomonas cervicalis ATCC 49957]|uniref:Uncharacterized protein n=1 Tax=Pseudoroseomonas cervicalis ATCC 49957 TaxID=525371 RepID=D5RPA2_9PROT|nr:hypothetical protein HMPREF0731_2913 [Pseudoroseomonas cervicalis ATCC 49957]
MRYYFMMKPFRGSRLKIERAKHHLDSLQKQIEDYIYSKPFKIGIKDNGWRYGPKIKIERDPPFFLPTIIGDIVHNLRVSLDLLASDLVRINGGNTKGVYFPFCESSKDLKSTIKQRNLHRASVEAQNLIISLKPYKGGNSLLRALHDLDITDKHKMLIPAITGISSEGFEIFIDIFEDPCILLEMSIQYDDESKEHPWKYEYFDEDISSEFYRSIKFVFGREIFDKDVDVIEFLKKIADLVEDIIALFEKKFENIILDYITNKQVQTRSTVKIKFEIIKNECNNYINNNSIKK